MVDAEREAVRNVNAEKLTAFPTAEGWVTRPRYRCLGVRTGSTLGPCPIATQGPARERPAAWPWRDWCRL